MVIKKRKLYQCTALSLLVLFIVIFMIPSAFAGSISDFPKYMLDTINSGVTNVFIDNLSADNSFYKLMVGDYTGGGKATGLSDGIKAVMTATNSVAMLSVLVITMIRLFQELDKGGDVKESLYKSMTTMFLMGILVLNIDVILRFVVQIGEWLVGIVADLHKEPTDNTITLKQITGKNKGGIIWWIQSFAILIIPWILTLLMSLVAKFMAFSILIELGIRRAFAPFAIVDIYSEGMRSPGMRYLKRYLAAFLKIVVALLVVYMGLELMKISIDKNLLNETSIKNILNYIFEVIAVNFTILGVITKSGEYTNDIVGA